MKKLILTILAVLILSFTVNAETLAVTGKGLTSHPILGEVWHVVTTGTKSSDYIAFGYAEENTGTNAQGQTVQPKYDFTLKVTNAEESCQYSITPNSMVNVESYTYKRWEKLWFWQVGGIVEANCYKSNSLMNYIVGPNLLFQYDLVCSYKEQIGYGGYISEGGAKFKSKFELTKEGDAPVLTEFGTSGSTAEQLQKSVIVKANGQDVGVISWGGYGLSSGSICPNPVNYGLQAMQNPVGQAWSLARIDSYDSYKIVNKAFIDQNNLLQRKAEKGERASQTESDNYLRLLSESNDVAANAVGGGINDIGGKPITFSGASINMILPRDYIVFNPLFDIYLKADYLQAVLMVGQPKIISAEFKGCSETDIANNHIFVNIKNEGKGTSSVVSTVTCNPSGLTLQTGTPLVLDAGESGSLDIPFAIEIAKNTAITCTATVQDKNWPANKDTKSVTTNCVAKTFCSAGDSKCVGQDYYGCKDGQYVKDATNTSCQDVCPGGICRNCDGDSKCELGETFDKCGGKNAAQNDCATCNSDSKCDATETAASCKSDCTVPPGFNWLYVIGGVAAAGALAYALMMYKPKKGKRK